MRRRSLFLLLTLAVTLAYAAEKPNFSGTWKLNAEKSDFGQMPVPAKLERVIQHREPTLTVHSKTSSPQGELKSDNTYTTDGKESTNSVRGVQVKSVASWQGRTLMIKSKRNVQNMEINAMELWSISPDGKVLTVVNTISGPQGDLVATSVMDKQ